MENNSNYCIIMAGGVGRRLWPCSRKAKPKQFLDFFGTGRTLLQQTFDRVSRFIPPSHIYISTFVEYTDLVNEQLPMLPAANILTEPVQLSTAPAAVRASAHIAVRDANAAVMAVPADQYIVDTDLYEQQLRDAFRYVHDHNEFLAIGVRATEPNTGYGYIQRGEEISTNLCRVKSFTEKPDIEYARMFVESGEFLWNTGLFLWNVHTMNERIKTLIPAMTPQAAESTPLTPQEELDIIIDHYPSTTHSSLDLTILGHSEKVVVRECTFGWADIGCWPELYQVEEKDADGNAVICDSRVMFSACRNNLVRLPSGTAAVIRGLDGYLVAASDNVLVICPNDDPALVRRLVNEAQVQLGEDFV